MLDWHLGMVETESGEPRPLGPADACTLARSWLVPLAAERAAPLVVAAGFALDAVDGPLARATAPTRAGRDLEGAVDAAFTVAALRGAVRSGGLGAGGGHARSGEAGHRLRGHLRRLLRRSRPPDRAAARAARGSSPVRAAGLLAAGLGYRRAANALVVAGVLAGVGAAASGAGLDHAVAGDPADRQRHHEVQAAAAGAALGGVLGGVAGGLDRALAAALAPRLPVAEDRLDDAHAPTLSEQAADLPRGAQHQERAQAAVEQAAAAQPRALLATLPARSLRFCFLVLVSVTPPGSRRGRLGWP